MKLIDQKNKIKIHELQKMSEKMFYEIVKAVIDIDKNIMAVDAEMHADEEQFLIEKKSKQFDLWGINLHPKNYDHENFIEFDSMINIRPMQNNRSRGVDDLKIKEKIIEIVKNLVEK